MSDPTPGSEREQAAVDQALAVISVMALQVSDRSGETYDEAFKRIKNSPLAATILDDAIANPNSHPAAAAALFLSSNLAWRSDV